MTPIHFTIKKCAYRFSFHLLAKAIRHKVKYKNNRYMRQIGPGAIRITYIFTGTFGKKSIRIKKANILGILRMAEVLNKYF